MIKYKVTADEKKYLVEVGAGNARRRPGGDALQPNARSSEINNSTQLTMAKSLFVRKF